MKSLAIGTYEITKSALDGYPDLTKYQNVKYIDTAISYNNDVILGNYLHKPGFRHLKLISKIAPQMAVLNYKMFMDNHLDNLKVDKIDIMLLHNNRCSDEDWISSIKKMKLDNRIMEVGVSNFTIPNLERYFEEFNEYPAYLEMEINPSYTDLDLIEFCDVHGIKIIAYCILGGKYSARKMISTYTVPGLVNRAASLADIVIVRSDNAEHLISLVSSLNEKMADEFVISTSSNDKVIVPNKYTPPQLFKLNTCTGVIEQYNQDISAFKYELFDDVHAVRYVNSLPEVDIPEWRLNNFYKLEFLTDARVYLMNLLRSGTFREFVDPHWNTIERVHDSIVCVRGGQYVVLTLYSLVNGKLSKILSKDGKLKLAVTEMK